MKKNKNISSYTASEIKRLKEQGANLTDWSKVDRLANSKSEVTDDDEDDIKMIDWETVKIGLPAKKT